MHTANRAQILRGRTTDVYFRRTKDVLTAEKLNPEVTMEVRSNSLPGDWPWGILAGLEEALELLEKRRVTVRSIAEGTLFRPREPVMEISGRYLDFGMMETALLGCLCQASGIATASARIRMLAWDKLLYSFGARRMHPAISPMVERSAFIAGFDGVATVMGAELIGAPPVGTMPHALVLIAGDTLQAFEAFHRHVDRKIARVVLIDTLQDEKFEALNVMKAFGHRVFGLRVDTPASRRGDLVEILKEIKWELAYRGYPSVKLIVSGGIGEENIRAVNEVADGYGIGTHISSAPAIDFSLDIVEIEGEPTAKKGKRSGRKKLMRCGRCLYSEVIPHFMNPAACPDCGDEMSSLLKTCMRRGRRTGKPKQPAKIRSAVLGQIKKLKEKAP
jgi:nicotinate phosphoribosyltransferase